MLKEKITNKISNIQKYNNFYFCNTNFTDLENKLINLIKSYQYKIYVYKLIIDFNTINFTRQYSNYCTINYHDGYHEFIAFNEIGLYCGLHFYLTECEIKIDEITQKNKLNLYSSYKNIKINNIYMDFKLDNTLTIDHQNYIDFCKLFLNTKKFYIYLDESKILKKNNFFYFFSEINNKNGKNINFTTVVKINQKSISYEKDQEIYNYCE